ncbi:hypothetical protein DPMN_036649 [Dreissena polymorpha]|uniref:Uncharacterized protein n=1 Tax=Dreissena polymorpha TaxID=45954 RepID=A0A9D4MCW9_DREPO|nr:hypothetical protein DPMN_036649 [Dreissena polymorpha]
MTAEEVIAKVCEEDQDWALLLGNLTQMDIRKAMCGNDTKEARDTASMLLNYVETLQVVNNKDLLKSVLIFVQKM